MQRSVRYVPSQRYAAAASERWHTVYHECHLSRRPPRRFGSAQIEFGALVSTDFPDIGVLEISRGLILGPHGWLIAQNQYFLGDHSWFGIDLDHCIPLHTPDLFDKYRRVTLNGTCLSLASDWASCNYSHFLLDSVSRLDLFTRAGYTMETVDFVYLPRPPSPAAALLLKRLGIPLSKCIWAAEHVSVTADIIIAPSFPGLRRNYPPWVPEFLKSLFHTQNTIADRYLYLRRQSAHRTLQHEERILRTVLSAGFDIIDLENIVDAQKLFSEARFVIGAHDAGLAHLAFCPTTTSVLELLPTDHIFPYYYTLAESAGLRYSYLAGQSAANRPPGSWGPSQVDFSVDEQEFDSALGQILNDTGIR
jgi:hypothetical protein